MDTIEKEVEQHEKRNLVVFAANQIFMRLGWIFKTESVVMPGFIDVYTLSGFIRGLLPPHLSNWAEHTSDSYRTPCGKNAKKTNGVYTFRLRYYLSLASIGVNP